MQPIASVIWDSSTYGLYGYLVLVAGGIVATVLGLCWRFFVHGGRESGDAIGQNLPQSSISSASFPKLCRASLEKI